MVSNEYFEKQLQNEDYNKIMNYVIGRFRHNLTYDELQQLKNIALFNTISTFDPTRGAKFETHLYNKTLHYMLFTLKKENKQTRNISYYADCVDYVKEDYNDFKHNSLVNTALESLNHTDREFIVNKYIDNMTLAEIGKKFNLSKECVRLRINKILRKLQHDT